MAYAQPYTTLARRLLRLLGWNALVLGAGVLLVAAAAEAWLRTASFPITVQPRVWVPNVGSMYRPHTWSYIRKDDFEQRSRSNSLGFLDREPPTPESAAESCHIAMIGDSFVAARQVPIAAKFHVRLQELAARATPALDVTTAAYGVDGTGQINQLPLYEEYARHLAPKLIVLVFVANDYIDNSRIKYMLRFRTVKCRWACATRDEDGTFALLSPSSVRTFAIDDVVGSNSYLLEWLRQIYHRSVAPARTPYPLFAAAVDEAVHARQSAVGDVGDYYAGLYSELAAYVPPAEGLIKMVLRDPESAIYREGMALTAFALDEFKKRATRDGARLVILRAEAPEGAPIMEMAAERGIPIIHLADYVRRQGGRMQDARWPKDRHWNPVGHQWAAEALLEYLARNRHVCEGRQGPRPSDG